MCYANPTNALARHFGPVIYPYLLPFRSGLHYDWPTSEKTNISKDKMMILIRGKAYVTIASGILGVLALTLFVGTSTSVQAVQGNTVSSITGDFILDEAGTVGNRPYLGIGLVKLDGKGGVQGITTMSGKGTGTVTSTVSGSYVVNNDGTGSMVLRYSSSGPTTIAEDGTEVIGTLLEGATYNFVAVSANHLRAIRTEGGQSVSASLSKQQ